MKIWISGKPPNAAITLEAESQAERDQIERLHREAKAASADTLNREYDPAGTLRLRLETR